jgi:4-amino-4-deoxy-L-arabinose transferase-like glycosyltransferase
MPEMLKRVAYAGAVLHCLSWAINANYEKPDPLHTILILAGAACLALIVRGDQHAGWAALGYALVVGLAFHLTYNPQGYGGSDVIKATDEALRTLTLGANPYTHVFLQTSNVGAPFTYMPGELALYGLWKLAFGNIFLADRVAAICILVILAALAPLVGRPIAALATALYGLSPMAVLRAVEGSNDTALAFLIYVAVVLLVLALRSPPENRFASLELALSAIACGWALAFKATAFLVLPFVFVYLYRNGAPWQRYLAISLGTFAIFTLPFMVWNPAGFIHNVVFGPFAHADIYGLNVWNLIAYFSPASARFLNPAITVVELAAVIVAGVTLARLPMKNLGLALLSGCALLLVALMFARWSSAAYYTFLFTIALLGTELALADAFDRERQPLEG